MLPRPPDTSTRARRGRRRAGSAILLAALAIAGGGSRPTAASSSPDARVPVIVVPGITGTQLEDTRTGALVWGRTRQLLAPRDGGYSLALPIAFDGDPPHPQKSYRTRGPVWKIHLIFWKKQIYGPLVAHLERSGYRLGRLEDPRPADSLFFLDYDWRQSSAETAARLGAAIESLRRDRGDKLEVDLICQSNAAKICRYLLKYGAARLDEASTGGSPRHEGRHVRKAILVGASNGGSLRVLAFLDRGRRYVPLVGRRISEETFFSLRSLFDDLPTTAGDLFFDSRGRPLEIDLFRAESWVTYGWSVFAPKVRRRLARRQRFDLFGSEDERIRHLERQLARARRFRDLLSRDAPGFPQVRYYRLENRSKPTMARALILRREGGWKTLFLGDRAVDRDRALRALAAAPGDGHATLESQRRLSPQEEQALAGAATVGGGHFEMILEPEGLDAITTFLAD